MRLSDLLRCSKPLLFENDSEEFEYSDGGTFFFCKYRNRYFAVTAKHCLQKFHINDIRLIWDEYSTDNEEFAPLKQYLAPIKPEGDDQDFYDFAFIELDEMKMTNSQKNSDWLISIDEIMRSDIYLKIGDKLVARGFPMCLNTIEYDSKKIKNQALVLEGGYEGPAKEIHVHIFKFDKINNITSFNGMSGAPVFVVHELAKGVECLFVGVIIRGGIEAGLCRFIDCSVIFTALQKIIS